MAYLQLASAIGGGSGFGDSGPLCLVFLALSLCLLGAGLRLLWRGHRR